MADNITVTQGSGTSMATDDVGGVQYPRVKVSWGTDNSAVDTSASNPLPVVQTGAHTVTAAEAKAEDVAASGGDALIPIAAVRRDSAASGVGTDGDYATINVDVNGKVWTNAEITSSIPAGTNNIGDVDVLTLPALATGTNTIGSVSLVPKTSGGLSVSYITSAASTNATVAKASAGQVYAIHAFNTNAAARYLRFYNTASSPTVGTTTTVAKYTIPGNTAGAGISIPIPNGLAFSTGIAYSLTTGVADSDTGAVAANELVINVLYA